MKSKTVLNPLTGEQVSEVPGMVTRYFVTKAIGDELELFENAPKWALIAGARAAYGLSPEGYSQDKEASKKTA